MDLAAPSKESIIAVCQKIVKDKGLRAINMRAVASECNVAVGSLYKYFPSKSELLSVTVESIWKDIFFMAEKPLEFSDFVECLSWLFASIKEGGEKYPEFFSMHSFSVASKEIVNHQRMEEYFAHLKGSLLEVLKKDTKIKKDVFNDVFTPMVFIDYIFRIFISILLDSQQGFDGLLEMARKCLY